MDGDIVWGADPGLHGAICAVDFGRRIVRVIHMPLQPGAAGRRQIDIRLLLRAVSALRSTLPPSLIVVEQVSAMPRQGVTSSFSFGASYGALRACLATCGAPELLVHPAQWKRAMSLDHDKKASIARAMELIEEESLKGWAPHGNYNDGPAEALLLAAYGRAFAAGIPAQGR